MFSFFIFRAISPIREFAPAAITPVAANRSDTESLTYLLSAACVTFFVHLYLLNLLK